MNHRITLESIARQSGVSLATVSLVLRGKPGINQATRQRVLDVARDLGYRKRAHFERAGTQAVHHIGVLVKVQADADPQVNPFHAPVVAGIEVACRKLQINLFYATVPVNSDNHPQELPRMLFENQLNGLVLVGAFADQTVGRLLQPQSMARVLVDDHANVYPSDAVLIDNVRGAYDAVSYLIRCGHRRIGLIGEDSQGCARLAERRAGYLQALRDHGIEPYCSDSYPGSEAILEAALAFLRRYPELTAVFCTNDAAAVGVIQVARVLGRVVPDDLSVIGFDNTDLSQHVIPPLTTMHVDTISMGQLAVQTLMYRAEYPDCGPVTTMVHPTLVARKTVQTIGTGQSRANTCPVQNNSLPETSVASDNGHDRRLER